MAHCPVCNMDVDDASQHAMEAAGKGDKAHKEAMDNMKSGMGGDSDNDGDNHGKM